VADARRGAVSNAMNYFIAAVDVNVPSLAFPRGLRLGPFSNVVAIAILILVAVFATRPESARAPTLQGDHR